MKTFALLVVLLFPGLGLGEDARVRRQRLLALIGFGCALDECMHAAAWLMGLGRIHAAVAAASWLAPILVGRRQRILERRARHPAK